MKELSHSSGIGVSDIRRSLLNGGNVSPLLPVLKTATGNAPVPGLLSTGLPLELPPATALLEPLDGGLASLVRQWETGRESDPLPIGNAEFIMVGIARYGCNVSAHLEAIIDEARPDIVTIDLSPSSLGANTLYCCGIPAAAGLSIFSEIRDLKSGQLYTSDALYPGNACQTAILRCWLDKIPLVPVGRPEKPVKTLMGITNEEMPQPHISKIYGAFDDLLDEVAGLKAASVIDRNRLICSRLSTWLRTDLSRQQIEESGYIASRISDISSFRTKRGRKLKILSIVDVKQYENAQYSLELLEKGITDEVYVPPRQDYPASVMYSRYLEKPDENAGQYLPETTRLQELFKTALGEHSRAREEEAIPESQLHSAITAIAGRTRNHPGILRGSSVRGSIALEEVMRGYGEMRGAVTWSCLKNAALLTITPRIITREGDDETAMAIIEDIVKEITYGIRFSRTAPYNSLVNDLDWLSPEDVMEALKDLDPAGMGREQDLKERQEGRGIMAMADRDNREMSGQPDFNSLQSNSPGSQKASSTVRAIERLMGMLDEKLASGEISREQYQREKYKLQGMLDAASYLSTQMAGQEMAKTVFELMDAQDKHWGKKLDFEDIHVYYHIKGTSEKSELSPPKQGYYRLRVLIDTMEQEGLLKAATQDKAFSLTGDALNILLQMMMPRAKKGRELADVLASGKAPPGDIKYDIQRYSPGNVFRDISVRHTLREIARRKRRPSEIQRRDLRVFIRQPRKLQSDIVLCIDTSGSMGYRHKLTYARLAAARLAKTAVERGDRVGIMDFDDLGKTLLPLGKNKNELIACIAGVSAGGNTNIGDGIETASGMLLRHPGQNEKHIVLITDGQPSALSKQALDQLDGGPGQDLTEEYAIVETRRAALKGIKTSVIHIIDDNEAGRDFVKAVARAGNGEVTKVRNPADLRLAVS